MGQALPPLWSVPGSSGQPFVAEQAEDAATGVPSALPPARRPARGRAPSAGPSVRGPKGGATGCGPGGRQPPPAPLYLPDDIEHDARGRLAGVRAQSRCLVGGEAGQAGRDDPERPVPPRHVLAEELTGRVRHGVFRHAGRAAQSCSKAST